MINHPHQLSSRLERLRSSPIREILSLASKPGMISFAGGLPAYSELPKIDANSILKSDLQYGPSEGEPALRERISKDLITRGLKVGPNNIIVLSGSQQGIDLVAKLVIDHGTPVAVESPTYLAALQVFSLFGARYIPFSIDHLEAAFQGKKPAMLYCVPTFQNPSSHTYSREQRIKLAKHCDEHNTIVFEDDPYRELIYEDCETTPVVTHLKQSSWVYQASFSKTLAPGLRLGYLACSDDLYLPLLHLKQAADLHSSRVSQRLVLDLLNHNQAQVRIAKVRAQYKKRRDQFNVSLVTHFADIATWSIPCGGLFFWLKLKTKQQICMMDILPEAIDAGVAFMPGEPFFADDVSASNCLRLSFSNAEPKDVDPGLAILSNIVRQVIQKAE